MAQFLWAWPAFDHMKARHEAQIAKYPHTPVARGVPYEGITNLKPEVKEFMERVRKGYE